VSLAGARGTLAGAGLAVLLGGCAPPAPRAADVTLRCAAEGHALRQRCTVYVADRRTGRGIAGATVTLLADMPSMPLVHALAPVTAAPDSPPGTYRGMLALEMSGRWVVAVRVTGPVADQSTHVLDVN
jgi:hypothetical protein